MYRATTPTHTFTLPVDPADCDEIQVTYRQSGTVLEFHFDNHILPPGMVIDRNTVVITLTQEQTLMFDKGRAQVQVRVRMDNTIKASQKFNISVFDSINEEILS